MMNPIDQTMWVLHWTIARFSGVPLRLDLADERGTEDAPSKLIWIAAGIIIAVAATAFAWQKFKSAESEVPDPVAPGG